MNLKHVVYSQFNQDWLIKYYHGVSCSTHGLCVGISWFTVAKKLYSKQFKQEQQI